MSRIDKMESLLDACEAASLYDAFDELEPFDEEASDQDKAMEYLDHFQAIRATYFKRVEFINRDQFWGGIISNVDSKFHNDGIYNYGNDRTPGWDQYYENLY